MAKALDNSVYDAALAKLATSVNVTLCSAQPANHAGIAAVALAAGTHTSGLGNGSYTVANGDASGRKVTIAALNGLSVASSGTATHVAYDDGATLLAVTTCASTALSAGGTVSIGSHKLEIQAPT